jgi:hypothetical protein
LSHSPVPGAATPYGYSVYALYPILPFPKFFATSKNIFLEPQSGPNRNNQQMSPIITISGVFFPEDCTKGCLFSPPCDTCEMEVTYFIYFGTEDAGCNFQDSAATACQCTPLSGQVTQTCHGYLVLENNNMVKIC